MHVVRRKTDSIRSSGDIIFFFCNLVLHVDGSCRGVYIQNVRAFEEIKQSKSRDERS